MVESINYCIRSSIFAKIFQPVSPRLGNLPFQLPSAFQAVPLITVHTMRLIRVVTSTVRAPLKEHVTTRSLKA